MQKLKDIMWKPVKGFEGFYEVCFLGVARSVLRTSNTETGQRTYLPKMLTVWPDANGYPCVSLSRKGKRTPKTVHGLVAEAFVPNPDNLPQVNHKDKNRQNNHCLNLEWVTARGNQSHSYKEGFTSNYTGVSWEKGRNKWRATIYVSGKKVHLGLYKDEREAAKAYNLALDEFGLKNKYRNEV